MNEHQDDLPPDLRAKLMTFFRETNGEFEVADVRGLLNFVVENGQRHPVLLGLVNIDKGAVVEHFNRTDEVPPGIKLVRKTRESENVTKLEVLRGPIPPKS